MPHRILYSTTLQLAILLVSAVANLTTRAAEPAWFQRCWVGMEIGPTGAQSGSDASDVGFAEKLNGLDLVRHGVAAHCEYLVIWARDAEYTYYDSKLETKAPGLGKRDVLREAVDEGRRTGLPIIAACLQQYPTQVLKRHPEWRMIAGDGKPIERVCFRSGYLEYMKQLLSEQLAYGIDGLHLEKVDQGFGPPYGCWCATCEREFEAEFHRPMPKPGAWDEAWERVLKFRYSSSDIYEKKLTEHIHQLNPQATVDFSYPGNPPSSWEVGQRPTQHSANGDFVSSATGADGLNAISVGLNAEFYRSAFPGRPVQVAMQRCVRRAHDQTTRPLADLRWELFTLLAHGSLVTIVDKTGYDGWLDPVAYERIGAAFEEAQAQRAHFGQPSLGEVGLFFSEHTRDWYGRDHPAKYIQSFQGAHQALVCEHLLFGVVHAENSSLETLRQFPVILLPNITILSDSEIIRLREYVTFGGKLIVTGFTGQFDHHGLPLEESGLNELVGAKFIGRLEGLDNWVRFPGNESEPEFSADPARPKSKPKNKKNANAEPATGLALLSAGIRLDWPFLVEGPAAGYEPTTALPVGELLKPHRTLRQQQGIETTDLPMSADSPIGPALLINRIGEGTVLTLTCSPDYATASEQPIIEARRLLRNAVRFLNPQPAIEITAPANVEGVVTDDPVTKTLRVHLLGYNSPPQSAPARDRPTGRPTPMEEAPIYRVTVEVNRSIKRVEVLDKATQFKRHGNRLEATINNVHEVIVIRY